VPGKLGKNRAPADSLRLGLRWNGGIVEWWNTGEDGRSPHPLLQYSIVPLFQSSCPPPRVGGWVPKRDSSRLGSLLPGFPPTQGLPEILRSNGTDRSEADAPREEKGTTRHPPEPPLPTRKGSKVSGAFFREVRAENSFLCFIICETYRPPRASYRMNPASAGAAQAVGCGHGSGLWFCGRARQRAAAITAIE